MHFFAHQMADILLLSQKSSAIFPRRFLKRLRDSSESVMKHVGLLSKCMVRQLASRQPAAQGKLHSYAQGFAPHLTVAYPYTPIPCRHKRKKTQRFAVLSCSGTQDASVALRAPSNPLCPVALYPRKFSGRCAVFILCYGHQASFASLTAGHLHVCRFESRLSASVVSTPAPFGRGEA